MDGSAIQGRGRWRALRGSARRWLTAEASETQLGLALTFVAGAINAGGFLAVQQYTSHMTGIVSPTGDEVEGWLILVGGTPKEMLAHPPEFTYSRLLEAGELSRRLGAQIMGLGAFTKVVGDAGVTVAKQATLPVTTGNSYSASGALWAAHAAHVESIALPFLHAELTGRDATARIAPLLDARLATYDTLQARSR